MKKCMYENCDNKVVAGDEDFCPACILRTKESLVVANRALAMLESFTKNQQPDPFRVASVRGRA